MLYFIYAYVVKLVYTLSSDLRGLFHEGSSPSIGTKKGMIIMKFYQYWIIIITIVLVFISIFNITKMILLINKDNSNKIEKNKELDVNIRNLLISMALLSITSLIYIIFIFIQVR